MPIYEYHCTDCDSKFEALRSMSKADAPIECKSCTSINSTRMLSLFAAHIKGSGNKNSCSSPNSCNNPNGCCGGVCKN